MLVGVVVALQLAAPVFNFELPFLSFGSLWPWAIGGALALHVVASLVAVGVGAQLVSAPLRRHVPTVTAVLLVGLGLYAVLGRPTSVTAAVMKHQRMRGEVSDPEAAATCCGDDSGAAREVR